MIFLLIIIFTIASFYFFLYRDGSIKRIGGVASIVLLAISVVLLTANFASHFGMKQVTTSTSKQIYSANKQFDPAGLIIDQAIGTSGNAHAIVFRSSDSSTDTTTLTPDLTTINSTVADDSATTATLETKVTTWKFANGFYQFLFGLGGENNQLVKKEQIAHYPSKTWIVLTPAQLQTMITKQAQQAASLASNPTAAAAYAKQQQDLQTLKSSNPTAAAEQVIQQIKSLTN